MELEYEEAVNGVEVGESETSGKKLKLNLTLTQMKNQKSKNASMYLICFLLYTSVMMFAELQAHFRNFTPKGIS